MKHLTSIQQAPWIFGILNCTPDSFSDGGDYLQAEKAIQHARALTKAGAHVVDIGGESTRPGSTKVDSQTELLRIAPVIKALASEFLLSIDTYKSDVADFALQNGAKIINDVSGLRADPKMAEVCAKHNAGIIIMYSKELASSPHASNLDRPYQNMISEISDFLLQQAEYATAEGISSEQILLDPGMGRFISTNPEDSWKLLAEIGSLCRQVAPYPVMICSSRKGFLPGPLEGRDTCSQLTALHAISEGVAAIRTHNVEMLTQCLETWKHLGRI